MNVTDVLRRIRSGASSEAARIVALLREDPARGLVRVAGFVPSPPVLALLPAARLALLQPLFAAVSATLEPLARTLCVRPLPYAADELAGFHRAACALEALRDGFERAHVELADPTAAGDSDAPAPATAAALARALDAQSLRLITAWHLRIAVERDHWDRLCRLALPLWRGQVLDTAPSPAPDDGLSRRAPDEDGHRDEGETLSRPLRTPRAAVALPLLLRLLDPLGLSLAERRIVWMLAGEAAGAVGLRIDVDGRPHLSATGPALILSAHHTVRLDTRAALSVLDRIGERLAARVPPARLGLRTALGARAIVSLVERVRAAWAPLHVPAPLLRPPRPQAHLHLGLPSAAMHGFGEVHCPEPAVVSTAAPAAAPASPAGGAARMPYVFGRRRNGSETDAPPEAPSEVGAYATMTAAMHAIGERVSWRGQDARRSVFTRTARMPRLGLGQLVAVLPCRADAPAGAAPPARPGSETARLRVGRIVTLSQTGSIGSRQPFGHDVGIEFWPGTPLPLRLRLDDSDGFEDAWWLTAVPGMGPGSVVLRRDRFERPLEARVHAGAATRVLRLLRLLERGLDFDRVEVAPDAPDGRSA